MDLELAIPTNVTIVNPEPSDFVRRCAERAAAEAGELEQFHAAMRARAAKASRAVVEVPARSRAARAAIRPGAVRT